ncbi:MAG: MarR family transcriptional regulator [Polyangiaceae bacterium]
MAGGSSGGRSGKRGASGEGGRSAEREPKRRDEGAIDKLAEEVTQAGRELSSRTMLYQQALAERAGLTVSDWRSLDLITRAEDSLTPGQLAERINLSTGAITGVLDRLERAGYVRREKDPKDRRQVLVHVVDARTRELEPIQAPLAHAMHELCASYSNEELELVRDYCRKAAAIVADETLKLTQPAGSPANVEGEGGEQTFSRALGATARGHLIFTRGAAHVTLSGGAEPKLYQASFTGTQPTCVSSGDRVTVTYKFGILQVFDWRKSSARITLNSNIPWRIEIGGGVSHTEADLRDIDVTGVEIDGGASHLRCSLGAPKGTVTIRVGGGANSLTVLRPAGVPVRVAVGAGAVKVTIDTLKLGAVGGDLNWETADYARSKNRFDIVIAQGVSDLTVGQLEPA